MAITFFVDYQGGRKVLWVVTKTAKRAALSLLLHARVRTLKPRIRQQLLDSLLDRPRRVHQAGSFLSARIKPAFLRLRDIRIMRAIGAYGFRGFYETQRPFLQSVPTP